MSFPSGFETLLGLVIGIAGMATSQAADAD
jgi:hypothetical protein